MTLHLRVALPFAALALWPLAPALAADYEPPVFADEATEEYAPVEVGSGWYLRGDVAYNANDEYESSSFGPDPIYSFDEKNTPVSASVGVGYHLNDYLRLEANLAMVSRYRSSLDFTIYDAVGAEVSTSNIDTENRTWSGMVGAYADLGTFSGFTPYVGAGVGFASSKRSYTEAYTSVDPLDPNVLFTDEETKYGVAYTLGAGVAYEVAENTSIDLGYQYFSAPDAESVVLTGLGSYAIDKGLDFHQIKLGLRYDLW